MKWIILVLLLVLFLIVLVVLKMRSTVVEKFADNWIFDYVDKAYIICMPDRRKHMEAFLESAEFDATFVPAIEKSSIDEAELVSSGKLLQSHHLSIAEIACYLSHLRALQAFVDDDSAQTALIMEDDLKLILPDELDAFKTKVKDVLETPPKDWQFINMGPCWTWCEIRKPAGQQVYDSHSSKCSHFYVVTKEGARTIVDHAFPMFNIAYDVKIDILARQKRMRMYESGLQIAEQDRENVGSLLDHHDETTVCSTVPRSRGRRMLVFTSAGDSSRWYDRWLGLEREFDVCVKYYGDGGGEEHRRNADTFGRMKGGKFQNLYTWYHSNPEVLSNYDYVAVWDDDIEIDCADINAIFGVARQFDLWICQPSFTSDSKISHAHTEHVPGKMLTYTNFIEMNAPVFKKDKLVEFLESSENDGTLYGYGTDHLYQAILGQQTDKYAIVHSVVCRNPQDEEKMGGREITKLANQEKREAQWRAYRITPESIKTYASL
jgi:GR25 family glycosyltransferase involved in LPS biosynthesis